MFKHFERMYFTSSGSELTALFSFNFLFCIFDFDVGVRDPRIFQQNESELLGAKVKD